MDLGTAYKVLRESIDKDLIVGDAVYHVANPDVRGLVLGESDLIGMIKILFDKDVTFSGNPGRVDRMWECSKNLLHRTSKEAWANKKY